MIEAKRALEARIASGKPAPAVPPKALPLGAIREEPEVFQHRDPIPYQQRQHVANLMKVLKGGAPLDSIAVLWDGDGWVCIDGHHRLMAYRSAKWQDGVPVQAFTGTVDAAIGRAARGNSRDRLPMSKAEKCRAAWRLVVGTALSKSATANSAGVSLATVGNMRSVRDALLAKGRDAAALASTSWARARSDAQGLTFERDEWDEAREDAEAEKFREYLAAKYGPTCPLHLHAIVIRGLAAWDARLPDVARAEWLGDSYGRYGDELDDDDSPISF